MQANPVLVSPGLSITYKREQAYYEWYLLLFITGTQIATVQGGVDECGSIDFPSLFVRLDDPEIFSFIKLVTENDINNGKKKYSFPTELINQRSSLEKSLRPLES